MVAYVNGISTCEVDHPVSELGIPMSKGTRFRGCAASSTARKEACGTQALEGEDLPLARRQASEGEHRGPRPLQGVDRRLRGPRVRQAWVIRIEIAELEIEVRPFCANCGPGALRTSGSASPKATSAAVATMLGCPWQRRTAQT